jgi:hypothetical protein
MALLDEEGAAFGYYPQLQRQAARMRAAAQGRIPENLPDPRTYGFISGLLGTSPDELGMSVLSPNTQAAKEAAYYGYQLGNASQIAPVVVPAARATMSGVKSLGEEMATRVATGQSILPSLLEEPPIAMFAASPTSARQGVGKSKNRVGTTGQYVGAPQGIDSPQKLAAMRANYMKDVNQGIAGRDWYDDASKWISEVAPENRSQAIADAIGVSSQGTGVDSNLGFAVKGINQFAAGLPVETGRFPSNQSPLIQNALAGIQQHLGPKRQPFASNLSVEWNPSMAQYPVHDIWQGRAFGYKTPEGKPWDAGFSPQQHAFMDQQMVAIQDQ